MSYADLSQLSRLDSQAHNRNYLKTYSIATHNQFQKNPSPLVGLANKSATIYGDLIHPDYPLLSKSNFWTNKSYFPDPHLEKTSLESVSRKFLIHAPKSYLNKRKEELKPFVLSRDSLLHCSKIVERDLLCDNTDEMAKTIQTLVVEKGLDEEDQSLVNSYLNFLLESEVDVDEKYLQLGMFLFCFDQQSKKVFKKIKKFSPKKIEQIIRLKFFKEMQKRLDKLNAIITVDPEQALFHPGVDAKTQIPVEAAKILITSGGEINLGLIPILKTVFKNKDTPLLNYEINFQNTLSMIEQSKEVRLQISQTLKPKSKNMHSNHVIRTTLNLPFTHKVTDTDAKKCLLVALLSHLRQENSRSCFTTAIASSLLRSNPEQCIKDLQSLIRESFLSRTVDGVKHHVSFILHLGKTSLNTKLLLDRSGNVNPQPGRNNKIWKSNVYLTICQSLGIKFPKEFLLHFLHQRIKKNEHLEISIEDLLKEMSKYASKTLYDGTYSEGELNLLATLAFEANIMNPLLKVWENAIASISEPGISKSFFGFYFYNALISSIRDHLIKKFPEKPGSVKAVCKHLFEEIKEDFIYLYDPSISPKKWMIGGEEGAFVLFNKNGKEHVQDWHEIKNSDQIQVFIESKVQHLHIDKKLSPLHKTMKKYCSSKAFIPDLISNFQTGIVGKVESSPLSLPYFAEPWLVRSGYDAKRIIDTYFDMKKDVDSIQINPTNAQHLLTKLIKIYRSYSDKVKGIYKNNPYFLKPMRIINLHACCLMPGHPSFKKAWESEEVPIEEWIENHLIEEGVLIANSPVSDEVRENLLDYAKQEVPEKNWSKFEKSIKHHPAHISIQSFRNALVDAITKFQELHKKPKEVMQIEVDHILFHFLTEKQKCSLKQSAIHFADSNLHEGDNDLHYCFIVNPGTGAVEVWEIKDDNSDLHPLDQQILTENETWEIFDL